MMQNPTTYLKRNSGHTRILYSAPTEQIMFFVRRFIQNADWILELLSLTEKLLRQDNEAITKFERMIIQDYLQFRLLQTPQGLSLVDRAGHRLDTAELLNLREQIFAETEKRALFLYFNPTRHTMAKAFKQVLAKSRDKDLSEEQAAILRNSYLMHHEGTFYTLRGKALTPPSRSQRWIWKMVG